MIGNSLTHYRVTAKLGEGGMGEVYRASDTKLGREVAIKVLPASISRDPHSLGRFEREAKALAALNHPHIASIYGFEAERETHFLVLELVEGQTLSERLRRGRLPLDEALRVARQIAEAVEAAHAKGIIHRDLKPGNIKLTPEGRVKVLDFGLAKMEESVRGSGTPASDPDAPTLKAETTQPGAVMGTPAYMSPEQARGQEVDKRTDVWAFGCCLFECLAGSKPFRGDTVTDLMAEVLRSEPDWAALPAEVPREVVTLLHRCLEKDPRRRLSSLGDIAILLEDTTSSRLAGSPALMMAGADVESAARLERSRGWRHALPWALTTALAVAFALYALRSSRSATVSSAKPTLQTYTMNLHPDASLATLGIGGSMVVVSPDCSKVVYLGRKDGVEGLYWKRINDPEFRLIPDTTKAFGAPAFSPQSDRLVFFKQPDEIYLFSFQGGKPRKIGQTKVIVHGAHWNSDDQILFANADGIFMIEAKEGSTPKTILMLEKEKGEYLLMHPQFLPGAKAMLFSMISTNRGVSLEALDLATQARKKLDLRGSFNPLYYPATGHLLYGRDDVLWARPFDPQKLEFTGPEVSLVNDVGRDWMVASHQFSIANNGTLIYARGHQLDPRYELVWVRDRGAPEVLPLTPGNYALPRLAPDGKSVVVTRGLIRGETLLVNLGDGQATEVAEGDSETTTSAFAYDGTNVFFNRDVGGELTVFRKRADATGKTEEIYRVNYRAKGESGTRAEAISPDGRFLAITRTLNLGDILFKDLQSTNEPVPYANTPANEVGPRFSPDGRWLAYTANTGDRSEAYIRRVPDGGLPIQISRNGGVHPVWSRDGRKLYYRASKETMVVKIQSLEPLELEAPALFAPGRYRGAGLNAGPSYEAFADADGERLLMLKSVEDEPEPQGATQVTVKVHFDEYIREQTAAQSGPRAGP